MHVFRRVLDSGPVNGVLRKLAAALSPAKASTLNGVFAEIGAHVYAAQQAMIQQVQYATERGVKVALPSVPRTITLSNGHTMTLAYNRENLTVMFVTVSTSPTDLAFERAVWEMLCTSPLFEGDRNSINIRHHGLTRGTIACVPIPVVQHYEDTMERTPARADS